MSARRGAASDPDQHGDLIQDGRPQQPHRRAAGLLPGRRLPGLRGPPGRGPGHHAGPGLLRRHHRHRRGPGGHHGGLRRGELPVHRQPGSLQAAAQPDQPADRQPGGVGHAGGGGVLPLPAGLLRGQAAVVGPRPAALRRHQLPAHRLPLRVHQRAARHRRGQVHGHPAPAEASHEDPDGVLRDPDGLDGARLRLHPLGLHGLRDDLPARRGPPAQDLLRPDLAGGPAGLLPLLLPPGLRPGVRGPGGRHVRLLRPDLQGAVVQGRAGLQDGSDPQEAAQPPQDGGGADSGAGGLRPVLGAVLRLRPAAGLLPRAHIKGQELPGGLLRHRVHRHEQRGHQHPVLHERPAQPQAAEARRQVPAEAGDVRRHQVAGGGRGPDLLPPGDGGAGRGAAEVGGRNTGCSALVEAEPTGRAETQR